MHFQVRLWGGGPRGALWSTGPITRSQPYDLVMGLLPGKKRYCTEATWNCANVKFGEKSECLSAVLKICSGTNSELPYSRETLY